MFKLFLSISALLAIILAIDIRISGNRASTQSNDGTNDAIAGPIIHISEIPVIDKSILLPVEKTNKVESLLEKPVIKATPTFDINSITAEAYLVGNLETGEKYVSFNPDAVFPIASLSKLFTAIIADQNISSTTKITITQQMVDTFGDAGHLVKDEKFTVQELLYPLLLESSNDTAEAYAQFFGYDKFIKKMNDFVKKIGMSSTTFRDASGLSSANISNADDLFIFAKYLYKNQPALLEITRKTDFDLATSSEHGFHHFVSINPFVGYEPFIGGKTGRTVEAKESMVSLFKTKQGTTTYPVAVIILRSEFGEREIDTENVLDKFSQYLIHRPIKAN